MASPAYMWIIDEQGQEVKGNCTIKGREGSIEVLAFEHDIYIPTDPDTGTLTATRKHDAIQVTKAFGPESPELYKACCDGKTLQKIIIKWYQVDANGKEQEYFTHTLDNVKVVEVSPVLHHVKDKENERHTHEELVAFRYEKITWLHHDGNIQAFDTWTERS